MSENIITKRCTGKCKQEKDISCFVSNRGEGYVNKRCRECNDYDNSFYYTKDKLIQEIIPEGMSKCISCGFKGRNEFFINKNNKLVKKCICCRENDKQSRIKRQSKIIDQFNMINTSDSVINTNIKCMRCADENLTIESFDKDDNGNYLKECRVCLYKMQLQRKENRRLAETGESNGKLNCSGCGHLKAPSEFPYEWMDEVKLQCKNCLDRSRKRQETMYTNHQIIFNNAEELKNYEARLNQQEIEVYDKKCTKCGREFSSITNSKWKGDHVYKDWCKICLDENREYNQASGKTKNRLPIY